MLGEACLYFETENYRSEEIEIAPLKYTLYILFQQYIISEKQVNNNVAASVSNRKLSMWKKVNLHWFKQ